MFVAFVVSKTKIDLKSDIWRRAVCPVEIFFPPE
jgi:hypothetical protein